MIPVPAAAEKNIKNAAENSGPRAAISYKIFFLKWHFLK